MSNDSADSSDDADGDRHQQQITIVTTNPVVAAWRLAQMLGSPVRYDIAVIPILGWHRASLLVPALMSSPIEIPDHA